MKKDLFFLVVVLKDNTVGLIATGSGECTQFEGDVSGNSTLQWCRMQNYSKLVIIEDFTNWTRVFYVCNDNGKIIHQ